MPYKGKWHKWTDADCAAWLASGNEQYVSYAKGMTELYKQFIRNRLSFFLPHCDGKDFINDYTNDLVLLTKGNQQGGTAHGIAAVLFRCLKWNENWPCFKDHGIIAKPYDRAKRVLIATWSWENMAQAVWPEFLKLMPREELGVYAPGYGDEEWFPDEHATGKTQRAISFRGNAGRDITSLISKVQFFFRVYTQKQYAFETTQYDLVLADEQMPEPHFDGVDERGRTRDGFQVFFPLTGHKMKGFEDTGKSGWIYKKLFLGTDLKGHSLGKYKLWIDGVPDELYSKESKRKAYEKHVTIPHENKDKRAIRAGEARYYGGWEGAAETVLDNWDRDVHVIPDFTIPYNRWTLYRGLDHGRVRPFGGVCGAVTPWGDVVLYREFYEVGKTVPYNAKRVVEGCGNQRIKTGEETDEQSGMTWPVYEEQFVREHFWASVMDYHSFGTSVSDRNCTLGQLYNDYGLSCSGSKKNQNKMLIPKFQSFLEVDHTKQHIMYRLLQEGLIKQADFDNWLSHVGTNPGASRLYVMQSLKFFQVEIETWQNKGETDEPDDKNNHLMDSTMFLLAEDPQFYGGTETQPQEKDDGDEEKRSTYTGY